MDYNKEDFKGIQYNAFELEDGESVFDKWPEMKRFPEFKKKLSPNTDIEKVVRYIIFCYDKKTPLLTQKNLK